MKLRPGLLATVAALCITAGAGRAQDMEWVKATDSAGWTGRVAFPVVAFDGRIWVLGGFTYPSGRNPEPSNDVWYSANGVSWTEATDSAGWSKRYGHAAVVFEGKIWVLGGYDEIGVTRDVWWSSDGASWTRATDSTGCSWRAYHSAVVNQGRMWVLGGLDSTGARNDVWSSADGVSWAQETDSAGWRGRTTPAVVLNGRIFIMGGGDWEHYFGDVWSSLDGKSWSIETDSAGWAARAAFAAAVHDSMIWVMGGWRTPRGNLNDVWCSTNGRDWIEATDSAPWSRREGLAALAFGGSIWILGGITDSTSPTDVWYSEGLGMYEEQNPGPGLLRAIYATPSPFTHSVSVVWESSVRSGEVARVHAQDGRMVRQTLIPAGEARWVWDGRDDSGGMLPPGVYVLETGLGVRAKVVKLK